MLAPNLNAEVAAHRRTLWRWHFYAALFVMPLLIVLAITGTIYCFQPQIEPLLYRDRMVVADTHGPQLPRDVLPPPSRPAPCRRSRKSKPIARAAPSSSFACLRARAKACM
jgi:hypothetical protein